MRPIKNTVIAKKKTFKSIAIFDESGVMISRRTFNPPIRLTVGDGMTITWNINLVDDDKCN